MLVRSDTASEFTTTEQVSDVSIAVELLKQNIAYYAAWCNAESQKAKNSVEARKLREAFLDAEDALEYLDEVSLNDIRKSGIMLAVGETCFGISISETGF